MKNIEELRKEIDVIDGEMVSLFEKRMGVVNSISAIKKEEDRPIADYDRESEVINNNLAKMKNEELKDYCVDFLNNVMRISKDYQSGEKVIVKRNGLSEVQNYFDLDRKVLIITDDNIPSNYYENIVKYSYESHVFVLPHGEINKSFTQYKNIIEFMVFNGFVKSDCVVAVGGGVVGDLAAFVASTYMRGIDFYNVPTTLLAQVDSSIGGKTAINFDKYKNLVGSFYNPKKVLVDVETLKTLNKRELYSGLVEAIKMGATCDKELFELIENSENILDDIEKIVAMSIKVKSKIVTLDPKDDNVRRVLNFGHTVGHAIETHNKFGTYLHGEAVGLGMLYFSSNEVKERLIKVLKKYDLPVEHYISKEKLFSKICMDKKRIDEYIYIVYVHEIGTFEIRRMLLKGIVNYL